MIRTTIIILFFNFLAGQIQAQDSTLISQTIDSITIRSTRIQTQLLRSPFAVTKLDLVKLKSTSHAFSLNDFLNTSAGIFALNEYNSAQDLRVSIRGFGSRSAFGIRGVKILVDGIPYTTPDGQGQVDNILIGSIDDMEVVKGPSSAYFGNASGGLININTFGQSAEDKTKISMGAGSFGEKRMILEAGKQWNDTGLQISAAYNDINGFRQHSASQNFLINGKLTSSFAKNFTMEYLPTFLYSPKGEDPGGVNLETRDTDKTLARDRNIQFNAGEELLQINNAVKFVKQFNKEAFWKTSIFHSYRTIDIRLPFDFGGAIDLNRNFWGFSTNYLKSVDIGNWQHKLLIGLDFQDQNDARIRYINNDGVRERETLNQREKFQNRSAYFSYQANSGALLLNSSLRYDYNIIKVNDFFLDNGDDSGNTNLSNFSPSIQLSYKIASLNYFFVGYSYGFETPTLSELTNRPDNLGGLNPDLKAQQSNNVELGYKMKIADRLDFNLTYFYIKANNELIPYELEEFPGKTFYQNSGQTNRNGIELSARLFLMDKISTSASYSYSNFKFGEFDLDGENLAGFYMPGIPKHNLFLGLYYESDFAQLALTGRIISNIYLKNDNSVEDEPYSLVNLNISKSWKFAKVELTPFVKLTNLLNADYNDNIRINAFGSRFYEPGPGRRIYVGASFEF